MNVIRCEQGSSAWFEARCGKLTASDVGKILTVTNGVVKPRTGVEPGKLRRTLQGEIWLGEPNMDGFVSSYMRRGTDLEPEARTAYEELMSVMVETVGFVIHPTITQSGCSPDGLINEDGGVELKCPSLQVHMGYMETPASLLEEYAPQVYWNACCTERPWWDIMSYYPGLPRVRVRAHALPEIVVPMETMVRGFVEDVQRVLTRLREMYPEPTPAPPREMSDEEFFDRMGFADVP